MIWCVPAKDCREDLLAARLRWSKLLLSQGIVYYGGHALTMVHDTWLRRQRLDATRVAAGVQHRPRHHARAVERRDRLDEEITRMAAKSAYTPVVTRLGCLRGGAALTGFGLAVEIGDWQRLTGRSSGAYLGPVPTKHSSGTSRSQGSITNTGNGHARRLIEAGWHHRPSAKLRRRWNEAGPGPRAAGQPASTRARGRVRCPSSASGASESRHRP